MDLYHDKPVSQGVENALKRAKQMVNIEWSPVRDIPAGEIRTTTEGKKYLDLFYPGYRPQKGVGYSSVRIHEKFVGDNVLFETYLSALTNPRSAMYTRPQHGLGRSMFNFYGTVCSSFAAYVLNLPVRVPCSAWPGISGVAAVDTTEMENLQLCDVVLKVGDHIAIITDIQRDINGKVHIITISESETPSCVAKDYTPEQFRGYWLDKGYGVYRYAGVHDVSYTPDPFAPVEGDPPMERPVINTVLQPDYGNKANYMLGDSVELDVLEGGWTHVSIAGPESVVLPVEEDLKVIYTPVVPGYYSACCVKGNQQSAPVVFRITDMDVTGNKTVCKQGEPLELTFHVDADDKALGFIVHNMDHFWRNAGFFSEAERAAGKTTVHGSLAPGEYYAFVMAQGSYGRYRSPGFRFRVEA